MRYIADTGDGGLFGTGHVNWYGDAAPVFYPNAYHLLAAVTYRLSGASIPATLDANTRAAARFARVVAGDAGA